MIYRKIALAAGLTVSLLACKKDNEPQPPPTTTQLLTNKNWQVKSGSISAPGQATIDLYALTPSFYRDDFVRYTLPNTYTYDEGPTKFRPTDPQVQLGVWALANSDKELIVTFKGLTTNYLIDKITADSLKLRVVRDQGNGVVSTTKTAWVVIP